jgi:hypothetical protein
MITNMGQLIVYLPKTFLCSAASKWAGGFAAAVSVVTLFLLFWRFLYFRICSWLHPDEPAELPYWIPGNLLPSNREVI